MKQTFERLGISQLGIERLQGAEFEFESSDPRTPLELNSEVAGVECTGSGLVNDGQPYLILHTAYGDDLVIYRNTQNQVGIFPARLFRQETDFAEIKVIVGTLKFSVFG